MAAARTIALSLAVLLSPAARADRALVFATPNAGPSADALRALAVDRAGNAYVAGKETDATTGLFSPFVRKLDVAGRAVWTTFVSPEGAVFTLAVDGAGRVHLGGAADVAGGFRTTPDALVPASSGGFYMRLSAEGAIEYSTMIPLQTTGIDVDPDGRVHLAGYPQLGPDTEPFAVTADAFRIAPGAGLYMRLAPSGRAVEYGTYLAGTCEDVAVDAVGNAFVVGRTDSPEFQVVNALQATPPSASSGYVVKVGAGHEVQFATYLGGSTAWQGGDVFTVPEEVAVGPDGAPVIVGVTSAIDLPLLNAFQPAGSVPSAGFVTKLAADGASLVYSSYLDAYGRAVAVDRWNVAHLAASGYYGSFPYSSWLHVGILRAGPSGDLLDSRYVIGRDDDYALAVGVDDLGSTLVSGFTDSYDFPWVRPATPPPPLDPWFDGFLVKFGVGLPGSASGSGTFLSPAGAVASDPAHSGRADLTLTAALGAGALEPTGSVEFTVAKSGIGFRGGIPGIFIGWGTSAEIHGLAAALDGRPVRFVVTISDGPSSHDPDLVRVKVSDAATGEVIYDSQPGATDWAAPAAPLSKGAGFVIAGF